MTSFTYEAGPARVVFGSGTLRLVGPEVRRLGGTRVLLLSGPHQAKAAAPAQPAGNQAAGPQTAAAQPAEAQAAGTQTAGAEVTGTHETDTPYAWALDMQREIGGTLVTAGAEAAGAQAAGDQPAGTEAAGGQPAGTQAARAEAAGGRAAGAQAAGPQAAAAQTAGTQTAGAEVTVTQAVAAQVAGGRGAGARTAEAWAAGPQTAVAQTAVDQTAVGQTAVAQVAEALGPLLVGQFNGAAMHTPVEVTEQALAVLRETGADCVVAVGGGSTVNLGKALALRTDVPQVVVPTTYAGSEATPVLGETSNGQKTTQRSPAVLPETIVYDVDLTLTLPVGLSVTSGINALAHAVEALYSPDANPVTDQLALAAIRGLAHGLPAIVADAMDVDARAEVLRAAWLASMCLGTVGMSLHHKLCHTLGGSFGLPHSETHTVVLPHAMAYNAPAAMDRIADALGVTDAPTGVYDLITSLGGPTSLRDLGMDAADLPAAAELATAKAYPNPRELTRDGILALLEDAWAGRRPHDTASDVDKLTGQVVASFGQAPPRARTLMQDLVKTLHSYVKRNDVTESEWQYAIDFLTRAGHITDDKRQEFILLSDTLGVSSVVDLLTNSRTPDTTPSAVLGPFYVQGPPALPQGVDIANGLPGTPLWADIQVTDVHGKPLADTVVDVWQANEDGFYDVQLPELDGPVLRARFHTDDEGRLRFWTILPAAYPIPADGPVGQMLGAVGRHPYRAPHVHFMIAKPGYHTLVTQLFVRGGEYLDSDTVFGVKDALIVDFPEQHGPTPDGRDVDHWRRVDFVFHVTEER